jgi:hypothetical protein
MNRARDFDFDPGVLARLLETRFPTLHVVRQLDGGTVVAGSFLVEHEGRRLDSFTIEVDLRPFRGGKLPEVREMGGRIPRTEARHANPDGTACVCHPADYFQRHPGHFDPIAFLEGPSGTTATPARISGSRDSLRISP